MAKFYFLNHNKEWQGPYNAFVIIAFAIFGTLDPDTLLWSNKLINDGSQHPLKCIYARKIASEYQFLPSWVFWKNIRTFSINKCRGLVSKLKKQSSWSQMLKVPPKIPTIFKDAPTLNIIPSVNAINDFAMPGRFEVELEFIDSESTLRKFKYPIEIKIDSNPGICFEIIMENIPSVNGVLHKESYGLHHQLTLSNPNESLNISRNSVFDFSTHFPYKPQYLRGRFNQMNIITENGYSDNYNRLILKLNDDNVVHPLDILSRIGSHIFDHETLNVDNSSLIGIPMFNGGGYSLTKINGKNYKIFSIKKSIMVIDGLIKEDINTFKHNAEIIRVALAILSGKFYGDACYYLTSVFHDFKTIEGVWYEVGRNSVLSERRLINNQFFRQVFEDELKDNKSLLRLADTSFPPEVFSDLCEALANKENLLHVAELVVTAMGNRDAVQQGALYSVALEALTEELSSASSSDLKPIQDKSLAKAFKDDLLACLERHKKNISKDGAEILKKKIEAINSPTNQDKLSKTFGLYSINLTTEDLSVISKRNNYLHGKSPLDRKLNFELMQISLRLHTLIIALLIKSVGYKGHIINIDSLAFIIAGNGDDIKSIVKDLIEEMQAAKERGDVELFEAKKSEAEDYKNKIDRKLTDIIRMI